MCAYVQSKLYEALVFNRVGSKSIYLFLTYLNNVYKKHIRHQQLRSLLYSTERVIEIPFCLNNIARTRVSKKKSLKILELGDVIAKKLASEGNDVLLVDLNPDSHTAANLRILKHDIAEVKLPTSSFDVVVSISSLEHIGLGAYKTPIFRNGDLVAMKILRDALKLDGTIIFTVPYGKASQTNFKRVYDQERLARLIQGLKETQVELWKFDRFKWRRSSEEEASLVDSSVSVCAVALVRAIK